MIDLYYWPTPNGHKITIFLEETSVPYKIIPINIKNGDQFKPDFLKISPNGKMPAIVDHKPINMKGNFPLFESGAILQYLADKTKKFLPEKSSKRYVVLEWLFWQMSGLGPMSGQAYHFLEFAPEKIPYAIERYTKEVNRLYTVLNTTLEGKDFITGEYSIADMACYPWIVPHEKLLQNLHQFPNINRWFSAIEKRAAVQVAYGRGEELKS